MPTCDCTSRCHAFFAMAGFALTAGSVALCRSLCEVRHRHGTPPPTPGPTPGECAWSHGGTAGTFGLAVVGAGCVGAALWKAARARTQQGHINRATALSDNSRREAMLLRTIFELRGDNARLTEAASERASTNLRRRRGTAQSSPPSTTVPQTAATDLSDTHSVQMLSSYSGEGWQPSAPQLGGGGTGSETWSDIPSPEDWELGRGVHAVAVATGGGSNARSEACWRRSTAHDPRPSSGRGSQTAAADLADTYSVQMLSSYSGEGWQPSASRLADRDGGGSWVERGPGVGPRPATTTITLRATPVASDGASHASSRPSSDCLEEIDMDNGVSTKQPATGECHYQPPAPNPLVR
jgi:hypothetical protein